MPEYFLYEKEPLQLCFTELPNLILRCYLTILAEIYGDPIFYGSGPGFVNTRIQVMLELALL